MLERPKVFFFYILLRTAYGIGATTGFHLPFTVGHMLEITLICALFYRVQASSVSGT